MMQSKGEVDNKPSILFSRVNCYQKRNPHTEEKKAVFKHIDLKRHPLIKVVMQKSSSRKIETDKFKTKMIDSEHFGFLSKMICRSQK